MIRPRHVLPTVVVAQFACTSPWFAGNAVLPELQAALGVQGLLGWTTSAVQLGFITGTLVFALSGLADRFPARLLFATCAVGVGLTNLGLLVQAGVSGLVAARFATGLCLAGVYPIGMKIAASWTREGLGAALGFLVGALVLGTALPHGLRALGTGLPWRWTVLGTSGLAVLGGLGLSALVADGPYVRASGRLRLGAVRQVFGEPRFRSAALGYFGHMWELYTVWALVPAILVAHDPELPVSAWSFVVLAAGFVGCAGGGLLAGRWGSAHVAGVQLAASGLLCLTSPLWLGAPTPVFLALLLGWGVVVAGDSPQFSTLNARAAPPELVGSGLTIVTCIGFGLTVASIQLAEALPLTVALPLLTIGPLLGLLGLRTSLRAERHPQA